MNAAAENSNPMAMPKKKSRSVTVAGTKYRWVASGSDDCILLFVELFENPASHLFLSFSGYEPTLVPNEHKDGTRSLSHAKQGTIISPAVVAAAIQAGLRSGWDPKARQPKYVRIFEDFDPTPWELASHGEQTQQEQADLFAWMFAGRQPEIRTSKSRSDELLTN